MKPSSSMAKRKSNQKVKKSLKNKIWLMNSNLLTFWITLRRKEDTSSVMVPGLWADSLREEPNIERNNSNPDLEKIAKNNLLKLLIKLPRILHCTSLAQRTSLNILLIPMQTKKTLSSMGQSLQQMTKKKTRMKVGDRRRESGSSEMVPDCLPPRLRQRQPSQRRIDY